ncbi:site-specific integrase [Microbacterium sp.]|uniref:tyrosine-type recombinase/integrase n=1 Tax=Microbacterium sp. TaxID=51671 RepID=UPI0026181A60|nr:site-specific integrase [Microbacterium sp.]
MAKRGQNTGSISSRPRKDGRWEARLTLPDGRRKSFYGKTWKEAEQKLQRARAELERGALPAQGRMTVDQLWDEYVRTNPKGLRKTTLFPRSYSWARHVSPVIGNVKLAKLTPMHIQRVVTTARKNGLNTHTVFSVYSNLKAVLEQAVRWQLIPSNPARSVDVPKGKPRELPLRTSEEVERFLAAIPRNPYRAAFMLAVGLGLRSGEVRGLRWSDIDFDRGTISVMQTASVLGGEIVYGEGKTDSARRVLPMPDFIRDVLREQRVRANEQRLRAFTWEDHDLVFPGRHGRPLSTNTLLMQLDAICEDAGVPRLTFHHLRHLCATLLLKQGVSPRIAQRILGHASSRVTLEVYQHVTEELLEGTMQDVDDALGKLLRVAE